MSLSIKKIRRQRRQDAAAKRIVRQKWLLKITFCLYHAAKLAIFFLVQKFYGKMLHFSSIATQKHRQQIQDMIFYLLLGMPRTGRAALAEVVEKPTKHVAADTVEAVAVHRAVVEFEVFELVDIRTFAGATEPAYYWQR